jgi:DNA-binding transcriptional MerR regulator
MTEINLTEDIENQLKSFHIPRYNELPDVDLYMDQVVSVLEKNLKIFERGENKVITSSMINNYVKQGVILAPEKKRYSKKHLAYLVITSLLKQVFPLNEVKDIINYLKLDNGGEIYDNYCSIFENAFSHAFKAERLNIDKTNTRDSILNMSATALADKIYVQKIMDCIILNDETEKIKKDKDKKTKEKIKEKESNEVKEND